MKTPVLKNIIGALVALVDGTIKEIMVEFISLGGAAKEHHKKNTPKEEVEKIYARMQEIYYSLRPFNSRLKELYPDLIDLFEVLDDTGVDGKGTEKKDGPKKVPEGSTTKTSQNGPPE